MKTKLTYNNFRFPGQLTSYVKFIADQIFPNETDGESELHATFYKNHDHFAGTIDYHKENKEVHYHNSFNDTDPYRGAYYAIKSLGDQIKTFSNNRSDTIEAVA